VAAAAALGLDPASVREALSSQMGAGRQGRGGRGRGAAARTSASTGEVVAGLTMADDGEQQSQGGQQRSMRGQRYGAAGQDSTGMRRGRRQGGANMNGGDETAGPGSTRPHPGLVFVAENGTFTPRVVMLGLGNYDVTQVISGLKEGERVALITAAMLQQSRDERLQRMRDRMALPGMRNDTQRDSSSNNNGQRGSRGSRGR
jgi:hypothetical protein